MLQRPNTGCLCYRVDDYQREAGDFVPRRNFITVNFPSLLMEASSSASRFISFGILFGFDVRDTKIAKGSEGSEGSERGSPSLPSAETATVDRQNRIFLCFAPSRHDIFWEPPVLSVREWPALLS